MLSMVLLPLRKPACFFSLLPFFSRSHDSRLFIILSMILPKQDVREIGRYDFGLAYGLPGLRIGMIEAFFQCSGT